MGWVTSGGSISPPQVSSVLSVAASRHEAAATPEALKIEADAEADLEGLAISLAAGHLTRRELPRWRARIRHALAGKRARVAALAELAAAGRAATRPAIDQVRVLRVRRPAPDRFPFPGCCTSPRRAELALEAARRAERVIAPDGVTLTTRGKLERASARAAERAAFSPFKSTGRTSLAGPPVRSNMPRAGGDR